MTVSVEIRYDGQDVTSLCLIEGTTFTSRANGQPGDCTIPIRDVGQTQFFVLGKTLELFINGEREWDGFLISRDLNYWFEGHTANCRPCNHLTPRRIILRGGDRNLLFSRRALYNKADPDQATNNIWPAGTPDQEIIYDSIAAYLETNDGMNNTTKVEEVASPDPYTEMRLPGPTDYFGDLMREVSQATGAVYFYDPDRYLVYTDVNTANAPFALSDRPTGGEVGYRDLEISFSADRMVNDAMIWGAGQGKDHITFRRVTDAASVATHGRWQNAGGYRGNLYKTPSVQRVAESIVYGSPSNKRGHKDDAVSVRCTIFEPGIRVAHKVTVESETHGFSDVLPVRSMTITFPAGPHNIQYDLELSHDLDKPWSTVEFWRPSRPQRDKPDCPILECNVPIPGGYSGTVLSAGSQLGTVYQGSHRVKRGSVTWGVGIESGRNVWTWSGGNQTADVCSTLTGTNTVTARIEAHWADKIFYTGITSQTATGMKTPGPRIWEIWTDYRRYRAATNTVWPGLGVTGIFKGTLSLSSKLQERIHVQDHPSKKSNPAPQRVAISVLLPEEGCKELRTIGAIGEYVMTDGEVRNINFPRGFDDGEFFYLSVGFMDTNIDGEGCAEMQASWTSITVDWRPRFPSGYSIGRDPFCQPIPLCGRSCVTARYDGPAVGSEGSVYRVPVAYVPGSTKVSIDGLHQRYGVDYVESAPASGEIVVSGDEQTVYVCFDGSGYRSSIVPGDTYFVLPVSGPITGSFGAQTETWPEGVWHGNYYPHFHNGVDFGVGTGTPVYAAANGLVAYEDQAAGGIMIHLYHANGLRTTYAHLSERLVAAGQAVSQGQLIARSGASGAVTGAHLHWGLVYAGSPEDPMPYTTYTDPHNAPPLTKE